MRSPSRPRPDLHTSHRAALPPRDADYNRGRDLPRLLAMWPEDLADISLEGRTALVRRLASVLRRERQRGLAGDWTYDLARHRQLLIAHRAEQAALLAAKWQFATRR